MQGVRLGGFDGCQAYFLFPCGVGGRCRACNVFQAVKHLRRCHALRPEPIGQPVKLFCCRVVHGVLSPPVRVFSLRRSAVCRVACCVCMVARLNAVCQAFNRAFCVLHNSARLNVVQIAQLNAGRQCAILFIIKTTRGYYMPISEAKKRNNANYTAKCDYINIRPLKPEGAKIRAAAENAGQSLQGYILQAIRERMERDGLPIDQPATDEEK